MKELADGLDRLGRRGVDDIGRAESFGLIQSLRLDIDNNDPRRTSEAGPADGIESDPSCAEDDDSVPSAYVRGVQDEPRPLQRRSRGEQPGGTEIPWVRRRVGSRGSAPVGRSRQPEALEKANIITA